MCDDDRIRSLFPGKFIYRRNTKLQFEFSDRDLDALYLSPYNRSIDRSHALKLKDDFIKDNAFDNKIVTTLLLAVVRDDLLKKSDSPLRIFIVDGQHRWTAMKALAKEYSSLKFDFIGDVEVVKRESDISDMVKSFQANCRALSSTSLEGITARSKFHEAMVRIVRRGGEMENRQCVRYVLLSPLMKDGTSLNRILNKMNIAEIEDRIIDIAKEYRRRYDVSRDASRTRRLVIQKTGLYQLAFRADEWLYKFDSNKRKADVDDNKMPTRKLRHCYY